MRPTLLLPFLAACGGSQLTWEPDADDFAWAEWEPQPVTIGYESDSMSHRSSGFAEVQGMEFSSTRASWVGMGSMACQLLTQVAALDIDADPNPDEDETVTDVEDGVVVTTSVDSVGLLDLDGAVLENLEIPGVIDARMSNEGIIALAQVDDGCLLQVGDTGSLTLPGTCEGSTAFAVDADTATSFVVTSVGVMRVDADQHAELLSPHGDRVSWDAHAQQLYVAKGSTLVAHAGDTLWTATIPGPIQEVVTVDDRAGAYVLTRQDRTSDIWWVDASTGEATHEMWVDAYVADIAVSPAGDRLGVVTQGQVDFFVID